MINKLLLLNSSITLPNIITILRILLTPLFIIFILKDLLIFALIVFTLAGISDGLDGFIARCYNQKSELGAHLDPIADKLLLSSGFICLASLGKIPNWLAVIVISRDIIIFIGLAVCYISNVKVPIKPSIASKITTFTQLLTVFLALCNINESFMSYLYMFFYWLTAILTIYSGLHYVYVGLNLLHEDK